VEDTKILRIAASVVITTALVTLICILITTNVTQTNTAHEKTIGIVEGVGNSLNIDNGIYSGETVVQLIRSAVSKGQVVYFMAPGYPCAYLYGYNNALAPMDVDESVSYLTQPSPKGKGLIRKPTNHYDAAATYDILQNTRLVSLKYNVWRLYDTEDNFIGYAVEVL